MVNYDALMAKRVKQIQKRIKEIEDTWDNRFGEDEEEYEEEY